MQYPLENVCMKYLRFLFIKHARYSRTMKPFALNHEKYVWFRCLCGWRPGTRGTQKEILRKWRQIKSYPEEEAWLESLRAIKTKQSE